MKDNENDEQFKKFARLYCFRIHCSFIFIHIFLPGQEGTGQGLGFEGEDGGFSQEFDRASLQVWRGGDQWI
jgi:hypothetical protein